MCFFLYKVFNEYNLDLFILVFVFLVIGDGYILEKEKGDNIATIFTQPISRKKYSIYKFISSIKIMLVFICFLVVFIVGLGFLSEGFGEVKFPIIEYVSTKIQSLEYINIISILEYNIRVLIFLILQGIFIIAIKQFISIFTRIKILQQSLTALFIILGFIINQILPNYMKHILPFNLLQASKVANGGVKIIYNMTNQNFYNSILVIVIFIVLFRILERIFINKKEQLSK